MMRNNEFFLEMKRIGHAYEGKRAAHQSMKQAIIDVFGWDSEELRVWYDEKKAIRFPYPPGASKAYRAWVWSIEKGEDEVEMNEFLWEREVGDFVETLRKAGVKSLVYTNKSTAVMDNLHDFAKEGCTLDGLCTITRRETMWGDEEEDAVQGIRFILN